MRHGLVLLFALFFAAACGGSGSADAGIDATLDEGVDASTDAGTDGGSHRTDAGFDAASLGACALDAAVDPDAAALPLGDPPLTSGSLQEDRASYVLTVLEQAAPLALIQADTTLVGLDAVYETSLRDGATTCGTDATCQHDHVVIDDAQLATAIAQTLTALGSGLADVAARMRESGLFERFVERGDDDTTLVTNALTDAIHDLDAAYGSYAMGDLTPAQVQTVLQGVVAAIPPGTLMTWWEPLARVVSAAMLLDGRDEAIRYESLSMGENAAAIAAVATTDFSHFQYAALVVPGEGPTNATTALNPVGAMRCDLAAQRYMAGLAPFILLTGGHVHPDRTTYSEAIEMKRYLRTTFSIPESAIFVDPYARHTTTNLRNATRILLRAGVPRSATVLIVSDAIQSAYIQADVFAVRCDDELHFRPWRGLDIRSPTDTCMTLAPISLTADGADALDP